MTPRWAWASVAFGLLLWATMAVASAQSLPPACERGVEELDVARHYTASIISTTTCIESGALSRENLAIGYYNRAQAKFHLWWFRLDPDTDEAYDVIESAYEDVEKAIEIEPRYAKALCLRGNIEYNLSWGEVGYDDIDKGRELGMSDEDCYLWD